MDKQIVVYPYNGIIFDKKKWTVSINTCTLRVKPIEIADPWFIETSSMRQKLIEKEYREIFYNNVNMIVPMTLLTMHIYQ